MADLTGLRDSIEAVAGKLETLKSVIQTLREGQIVQSALDDLKTRVDEISAELDDMIAEAQGGETPSTGTETPPDTTPPA